MKEEYLEDCETCRETGNGLIIDNAGEFRSGMIVESTDDPLSSRECRTVVKNGKMWVLDGNRKSYFWMDDGNDHHGTYELDLQNQDHVKAFHEKFRVVDESPAYKILKMFLVRRRDDSENRGKGQFYDILRSLIEGNIRFDDDDFEKLSKLDAVKILGVRPHEETYKNAIESGNTSAAIAYERLVGRRSFMLDGARLHVDSKFEWEGVEVKVTSFQDEKGVMIACKQIETRDERGWITQTKNDKVFRIDHERFDEWKKKKPETRDLSTVDEREHIDNHD